MSPRLQPLDVVLFSSVCSPVIVSSHPFCFSPTPFFFLVVHITVVRIFLLARVEVDSRRRGGLCYEFVLRL